LVVVFDTNISPDDFSVFLAEVLPPGAANTGIAKDKDEAISTVIIVMTNSFLIFVFTESVPQTYIRTSFLYAD
jgi:hypothetical protein